MSDGGITVLLALFWVATIATAIKVGWEERGNRHWRDEARIEELRWMLAMARREAMNNSYSDPCELCAYTRVTCPASGDPADCGGPEYEEANSDE